VPEFYRSRPLPPPPSVSLQAATGDQAAGRGRFFSALFFSLCARIRAKTSFCEVAFLFPRLSEVAEKIGRTGRRTELHGPVRSPFPLPCLGGALMAEISYFTPPLPLSFFLAVRK